MVLKIDGVSFSLLCNFIKILTFFVLYVIFLLNYCNELGEVFIMDRKIETYTCWFCNPVLGDDAIFKNGFDVGIDNANRLKNYSLVVSEMSFEKKKRLSELVSIWGIIVRSRRIEYLLDKYF